METERSHFPYRAIDRTKANLSVRHDDYVMFSFAGKHPLGLLPQSTTDGRLIPQYENNIDRHLDYGFTLPNGTYTVEMCFSDPWSCSKNPAVYANYGTEAEELLDQY